MCIATWTTFFNLISFIQVHVGGSVAVLGGKLYVSGGYDNTFELSDVVEAYDPATRTWTLAGRLPQPTFWHGSVSIFRQFMPLVSSAFEPTDVPESNAIHLHRHQRHQALHNLNNNLNQNQNQDVNPAHWVWTLEISVTFSVSVLIVPWVVYLITMLKLSKAEEETEHVQSSLSSF